MNAFYGCVPNVELQRKKVLRRRMLVCRSLFEDRQGLPGLHQLIMMKQSSASERKTFLLIPSNSRKEDHVFIVVPVVRGLFEVSMPSCASYFLSCHFGLAEGDCSQPLRAITCRLLIALSKSRWLDLCENQAPRQLSCKGRR